MHNTGEGGLSTHHRHGARAGLPDRDGVLRLPRRARALRPPAAEGPRRRRPGPGAGDQAEPGREARARRGAARPPRCRRRSPRPAACPRAWTASARRGTPSSPTPTACSTGWSCWPTETGLPVGIKSAVGDMAFWDELTDLMARDGRGVDFVTDRRRRGRHRRGAADLHRLRLAALPARLRPRLLGVRPRGPAGAGGLRRRGQARAARQRDRRVRARLRPGQRRPRGDAGDRLHPGAEVPHRHLPDRRRDAERVAGTRPGPGAEVGPRRQLRRARCAATCSRWPRPAASSTPA